MAKIAGESDLYEVDALGTRRVTQNKVSKSNLKNSPKRIIILASVTKHLRITPDCQKRYFFFMIGKEYGILDSKTMIFKKVECSYDSIG